MWEETSFALERLQAAEECVDQEQAGLKSRTAPTWKLPFTPAFTPADKMSSSDKVRPAHCVLTAQGDTAPWSSAMLQAVVIPSTQSKVLPVNHLAESMASSSMCASSCCVLAGPLCCLLNPYLWCHV